MTNTKLTFKNERAETGLRSVGNSYRTVTIKLNKKDVGRISPPTWQSPEHVWRIWLHKEDTTSGGGFKNVCLKAKFENEQSARNWVTKNSNAIIAIGLKGLE